MKNNKIIQVGIQIAVVTTILMLPYLLDVKNLKDVEMLLLNPFAFRYFISFILLIGFTYLHYLWLVPKIYLNRQFVLYAVCIGISLFTVLYLPEGIAQIFNIDDKIESETAFPPKNNKPNDFNSWSNHPPPPLRGEQPPPPMMLNQKPIINPKINIIIFFFISVFVGIFIHTDKRLQRIENEKLIAELAQLKAQINPHFLFNTLNNIYALAIRNDKKTAESILKLSQLMRFILKDAQKNQVSLEKEIAFIDNYIALQKYRLTDYMALEYEVVGNAKSKKIAPLLLITFIENAFKHGINPDEDCDILIHISIVKNDLTLHVFNKKVPMSPNQMSSGIGLTNTEERLQLLYPSKHHLDIQEDENTYTVELKLNLT